MQVSVYAYTDSNIKHIYFYESFYMFLLRQEPENMPIILKDRIYYKNCLSTIQEVKRQKQVHVAQLELVLLSWEEGPLGPGTQMLREMPADGAGVSEGTATLVHTLWKNCLPESAAAARSNCLNTWVTLDRNRKGQQGKGRKWERTF